MIEQPADARTLRANQNGGRIGRQNVSTLQLIRFNGETVEVNDALVSIPDVSGITCTVDGVNATIDATGADAAAAAAASTVYQVYLSNAAAALAVALGGTPLLRLCATAFATTGTVSGQRYLGATGDAANWRCIGQIRTNAAGQLGTNHAGSRLIQNYDNQLPTTIRCTPGYANAAAQTNVAVTANGVFAGLGGGTGDFIEYLADGVSPYSVQFDVPVVAGDAGAVSLWGIGDDAATTAQVAALVALGAVNVQASCSLQRVPTSGYHTLHAICSTGAAGATYAADFARFGGTLDPIGASLSGIILQ